MTTTLIKENTKEEFTITCPSCGREFTAYIDKNVTVKLRCAYCDSLMKSTPPHGQG